MERGDTDDGSDDAATVDEVEVSAATARVTSPDPSPDEEELQLPGHASTVVVPVANPETAGDLLDLAIALCEADGKVVALSVSLDDASEEASRPLSTQLRAAVDEVVAHARGRTVEVLSRPAPSIARGVLDVALESGADMLVLGVPVADGESSLLGPIAESIIDIAPCDVLLVRPGRHGEHVTDTERLVVTVDGHDASRSATRTAVLLGDGLHRPVEVAHVLESGRPPWDGHAVIARSLHGVEGGHGVERRLLRGSSTSDAVLQHCREHDLLVVGLHRETVLQRWLFGSFVTDLLRRSDGPVVVVARRHGADRPLTPLDRARQWLRPRLTDVEQETLLWQARRQANTTIDYVTLLGLSVVLATLGLVQDSVAVIIGAMLVAPLLGPLSAIAIGLVTARTPLFRRGAVTLALGTVAAIGVSLAVGLVLPLTGPTDQMLLRGAPSLLDVGVAMASGLVGAFATARKDIPAALAGVAIAAALVPPVCTVGLGMALGDASLAWGALLLYAINVSAVVATGAGAFWWFGLHPVEQDAATRRRIVSALMAAALALVVVTTVVGLVEAQRREQAAATQLETDLNVGEGVEVVDIEVGTDGDDVLVTATVRADRDLTDEELAAAEDQLNRQFEETVRLRVVVLRVVHPPSGAPDG